MHFTDAEKGGRGHNDFMIADLSFGGRDPSFLRFRVAQEAAIPTIRAALDCVHAQR